MLVKIVTVLESAGGKTYGKDLAGRVYFPAKGIELNANDFAFVVKTKQTKTYAADGTTLVDLTEPVELMQITATWPKKEDAIGAIAEMQLLGAEVVAEVASQAKTLKLTDEQVASLALAW